MKKVLELRDRVLEVLKGRLEGFVLAGGTALSVFYFQHRESYDLDFFMQEFSREKVVRLVDEISSAIKMDIKLAGEKNSDKLAKMMVYYMPVNKSHSLKLDFVEDFVKLIKEPNVFNGIPILSKEDIYIRKLHATCGTRSALDSAGHRKLLGGREEAKDFFDLYFLSTTFMPVSVFMNTYCSDTERERFVIWYNTYNRMEMKLGLKEIITDKEIDFQVMERRFREERDDMFKEDIR